MNSLYVGMKKQIITPPRPCSLQGQFAVRISEYVESEICANIFALTQGESELIICALDLCHIPVPFMEEIRRKVKEKNPKICTEKMIVAATHIHSGPVIIESISKLNEALHNAGLSREPVEIPPETMTTRENIEHITTLVADAVCSAYENRKKAFLAPAFARESVGYQRRVCYDDATAKMYGSTNTSVFDAMEGGNDSGIELLYVFDENKKPMGMLANVACPAQVVEHARYISSDYWGKVRDNMEKALGEDFVTVGLCSAAGDLSPRDMIRFKPKVGVKLPEGRLPRRADANMFYDEGIVELGERLAGCFLRTLEKLGDEMWETAELKNEVIELELPLRTVTLTEYDNAKKEFADFVRSLDHTVVTDKEAVAAHLPTGIIQRFEMQEKEAFYKIEVHIARLGDIAFATNPFELFLDFGNYIRARSNAAQTFLIQLSNGSGGYLPTERAEKGGHYSAYVTSGNVGHEGGKILAKKSVDMINKMF